MKKSIEVTKQAYVISDLRNNLNKKMEGARKFDIFLQT